MIQKKSAFILGAAYGLLWGIGTTARTVYDCAPDWSGVCGIGYGLINLPATILVVSFGIGSGTGTLGFIILGIIISLLDALLLGLLFCGVIFCKETISRTKV